MKLSLVLLGTTLAARAATTDFGAVRANNFDGNAGNGMPIYYLKSGVLAAVGQNVYVQILAGPVGGVLVPIVNSSGAGLMIPIGIGGAGAGFFDAGVGFVPGVAAGAEAQFEVRAWQGTAGFDNAQYAVNGPVWTQATARWNPFPIPPLPEAAILSPPWSSLTIVPVPEPSTLALALLGAVGWLQRRWRRFPK